MKRFLSVLLILATFFALVSCGGTKKEPTQPQVNESEDKSKLASKYRFTFEDHVDTAKSEADLEECMMSMIGSIVTDGSMYLQIHCQTNNTEAVGSFLASKGISYNDPGVGRDYIEGIVKEEMFDMIDTAFLLTLANVENVTKIVVRGDFSEKYIEALNVKVVAYLNGESENIDSPRDLQNWLDNFINACVGDKACDGVGVYLHGFEVQKGDLTGIPYSHISYGTKDEPMTILGFPRAAIANLKADFIVDMLSICPYFTLVEFFLTENADKPVLNDK